MWKTWVLAGLEGNFWVRGSAWVSENVTLYLTGFELSGELRTIPGQGADLVTMDVQRWSDASRDLSLFQYVDMINTLLRSISTKPADNVIMHFAIKASSTCVLESRHLQSLDRIPGSRS